MHLLVLVLGLVLLLAAPASASAEPYSLADALRLARERSPAVVTARGHVAELRAQAAVARMRDEPATLELAAGPRWSDDGKASTEADVAWELPIEGRGRRDARAGAAGAAVVTAELELEQAERGAEAEVAAAFAELLHAEAVASLALERVALARELLETATQRQIAGDASTLEVNTANIEVARAESERILGEAATAQTRARMQRMLGGSADITVIGNLADRVAFAGLDPGEAPPELLPSAELRSDVRAAQARVAEADADAALDRIEATPPLALRLGAAREEDTDALLAGVVIPLRSRARTRAAAESGAIRRETARALAASQRHAAVVDVEAALATWAATGAAAERLAEAVPLVEGNARMAQEAYAAGKFDLATVLLLRRDAHQARREHLDRQRDAALAGAALRTALGSATIGENP